MDEEKKKLELPTTIKGWLTFLAIIGSFFGGHMQPWIDLKSDDGGQTVRSNEKRIDALDGRLANHDERFLQWEARFERFERMLGKALRMEQPSSARKDGIDFKLDKNQGG